MKYASVFLVLLFAWWIWRKNRRAVGKPAPPVQQAHRAEQGGLMLQCAHCGLHLPEGDAVKGKIKSYCSLAHRAKAES